MILFQKTVEEFNFLVNKIIMISVILVSIFIGTITLIIGV